MWNSVKSLFYRKKLYNEAVKKISLSIEPGELVGFIGPNGSGKTTTLKMLSGVIFPTSGDAKVLGFTPWRRQTDFKKKFALVMGQKNQLAWDLPALESFRLNKAIYEISDKKFHDALDELSNLLDIDEIVDVPVRKLSLGQRMKCEIVMALLHSPQLLFLDEPTIGLDVVSQDKIRDFIKKYNTEKKTTVILTSHYMKDVVALCKRIIIISQGCIIYDGTLNELMNKYVNHKIIQVTFSERVERAVLAQYGVIKKLSTYQVVLHVKKSEVKEAATKMLSRLPVEDILIGEEDIDEVIKQIFQQK